MKDCPRKWGFLIVKVSSFICSSFLDFYLPLIVSMKLIFPKNMPTFLALSSCFYANALQKFTNAFACIHNLILAGSCIHFSVKQLWFFPYIIYFYLVKSKTLFNQSKQHKVAIHTFHGKYLDATIVWWKCKFTPITWSIWQNKEDPFPPIPYC